MNFDNCKLYNLKSKKVLKYILDIENNDILKQKIIVKKITPWINKQNGGRRLIESPNQELKGIQKRIKNQLNKIQVDENIFSGIKNKSYVGNARFHSESNFLYKVDLTAFFPSISRNNVYSFFFNDLCCSYDIAEILTNFTTIDLCKANIQNRNEIDEFLANKKITCTNHLISGAPTSIILSYLVNHSMFDELQKLSDNHDITMSIYVDDMTFSSQKRIPYLFINKVHTIIMKHGFKLSKKKIKSYKKHQNKLVTGVIITCNHELKVKNSLHLKTITQFKEVQKNPSKKSVTKLRGLVSSARQVDKSVFPSIYKYAYSIDLDSLPE